MEILTESIVWLFSDPSGWKYIVMWLIGGLLIYLAIKKEMEPTLLLPLGFGTIMVNLPFSGAIDQ
jgi:oxaloacetate decarboxylase beta subunit